MITQSKHITDNSGNRRKGFSFGWLLLWVIVVVLLLMGLWGTIVTLNDGIGSWGLNTSVTWGAAIVSFVWWIGIGHAGTFISAILLVFEKKWRHSINRMAEAMTVFALLCAAFYPLIHLGRPYFGYFVFPYPNDRLLYVNFNSALTWDAFAITTYFVISLIFWYMGMIPDFYLLKNTGKTWRRNLYNSLSLGWTDTIRNRLGLKITMKRLAILASILVVTVHTIVSLDFATSILPGWHVHIFPPYFVAGALFSGFAMLQIVAVSFRKSMNLQQLISIKHIDYMNRIILATALLLIFVYFFETFYGMISNHEFEHGIIIEKLHGRMRGFYIGMLIMNVLIPQLLWFKKIRQNISATIAISVLIVAGMWIERYVVVITSLIRDYMPSMWQDYLPGKVEIALLAGTIGVFILLFMVFSRFVPVIPKLNVD